MISRMVLFSCIMVFFGVIPTQLACFLRVLPERKPNRFKKISLMILPIVYFVSSLLPLDCLFMTKKVFLRSSAEFTYALSLACVFPLISIMVIWESRGASKISWQEYRKQKMRKVQLFYFVGLVFVLGLALSAMGYGRSAGFRALDKACGEARELVNRHPSVEAMQAGREYGSFFEAVSADEELIAIYKKEKSAWPPEKGLSRFVTTRIILLNKLETLVGGNDPVFLLKAFGTEFSCPMPQGAVNRGLRRSGFLLELATRQALASGNPRRGLKLMHLRLGLGRHVASFPGVWGLIAFDICLPGSDSVGHVLDMLTAVDAKALSNYACDLAAQRKTVARRVARAVIEEASACLIWTRRILDNSKGDEVQMARVINWFYLPVYGDEGISGFLSTFMRISKLIELPFEKARLSVRQFDRKQEGFIGGQLLVTMFDLLLHSGFEKHLARRANTEQEIGALEVACALRLHYLETGFYPQELRDLIPACFDATLLNPKGSIRLAYQRTDTGCQLSWHKWAVNGWVRLPDFTPVGEPLLLTKEKCHIFLSTTRKLGNINRE
jgi:hypothetical protein